VAQSLCVQEVQWVWGDLPATPPVGCYARHVRIAILSSALILVACGAKTSNGTGTTGQGEQLPACTFATGLADVGAGASNECSAARAYVTCKFSNGDGEGCLSDDPAQCPGAGPVGATGPSCQDACTSGEYGVACGGPGPSSQAQPPTGCRTIGITPGGTEFFCCPCL
jgi:hypothetical protein